MLLKKILFTTLIICFSSLSFAAPKNATIAITLIINHATLTDAYGGIMEALKENGYVEGENLKVLYAEAYGNFRLADQIAQDFVKAKPDVLIPISTPSAIAMIKADVDAKIPVVFSAVTDPVAAKLVPSLNQPGGYATGVYDFPPIPEQVDMIRKLLPQIKTLGVVYNPKEINSVRMVEALKTAANNINILEAQVNSIDDIENAANTLIGKIDAFYIPADNTVGSQIHKVLGVANDNRIPVFANGQDLVVQGALASLDYDPFEVGKMTGEMVAQVLAGKNPGMIDVIKPSIAKLSINKETAKNLNIKIPDELLKN